MKLEEFTSRLQALAGPQEGCWVSFSDTWWTVGTYSGYGSGSKRKMLGEGATIIRALGNAEQREEEDEEDN